MTSYNISINNELAIVVDRAMEAKKYANRSEFFRDLVRKYYCDEFTVEELTPDDPDYKIIEQKKKNAKLIPLRRVIEEIDVRNNNRSRRVKRA